MQRHTVKPPASMQRLDRKYPRGMRWDECFLRLPKGECRMAEIGVWAGGTCSRLLAAHPKLSMVLVDPWERAKEGTSYANSGSINASKDHERVYKGCMQRLQPFADRIIVHRMPSIEAAQLIDDASLDLVFIDGDHSYEGVSTDIQAWRFKLKIGGWIGGHDFGRKRHFFPGVEQAVREAFGDAFVLGSDSTWWVACT